MQTNRPVCVAAAASLIGCLATADAAPKPNIVHILTDDLGQQDVECYREGRPSLYETPNMNRLARDGMRFTQAYTPAPTCAPSRAAFMTGQYGVKNGVYHVMGGLLPRPLSQDFRYIAPFYASRIQLGTPVIPQELKKAGYVSGHIKKFHAGGKGHGYPTPLAYGFDFSWDSNDDYNDPDLWDKHMPHKQEYFNGLWLPQRPDRLHDFATSDPDDPYRTDPNDDDRPFDGTVDLAMRWMEKVRHNDEPFFLNYCTSMVHGPLSARDRKRFEYYCKKIGIPVPTTLGSVSKDPSGQKNPYYATMVDTTDWIVGKLVRYLEETDDPRNPGHTLIDNTYVIFSTDNGGCMGIPVKNEAGESEDEYATDNSPLRGGKQTPYEGGVRMPFIVRGPGIQAGAVSDAVVSLIDLFPTFLAMAEVEQESRPGTFPGHQATVAGKRSRPTEIVGAASLDLDGCNILPVLLGKEDAPRFADGRVRDTMYFFYPVEMPMSASMRKGPWKLYRNLGPGVNQAPAIELFKLVNEDGSPNDVSEANNLTDTHPQERDELLNQLNTWLTENHAGMPWKNPNFNKKDLPYQADVPNITGRGSGGDVVWATCETGPGKAKIASAMLLYTVNPKSMGGFHQSDEEWFEVPARVAGGRVEANAPPGMTHGVLYMRDENDFLITSEPLPPVNEVGYSTTDSQIVKDGFAYQPGLLAMIKCGESAVRNAREARLDTARLEAALADAQAVVRQPVDEKTYYIASARIRNEVRRFGDDVPEAGLRVLNLFPPDDLSGLNVSARGANPPRQTAKAAFDGNPTKR